jgi:integrase/recombinase XerD
MAYLPSKDPNCFENRMTALLGRIPQEGNRDLVRRYIRERLVAQIKPSTAFNDANALVAFCQPLGRKALPDVTKDDIIDYLTTATRVRIHRNVRKEGAPTITESQVRLGPRTLEQRKVLLRAFFRWLTGEEEPPQFKGIKPAKRLPSKVTASALLKPEEVRALLQAHPEHRNKALLALLAESGLRAGELCALNVGSVEFAGQYAHVSIPPNAPGLKTGPRRILIIDSIRYVHAWLEAHPRKNEPEAPLFYTMSRRKPGARLTIQGLYLFCRKAAERAGLKKHVHPHLFRHTAATEKARLGWNEAMLRAYFGWSNDSTMPSTYVHMVQQDYERIELARRGMLAGEGAPQPALAGLTCPACRAINAVTALWCEQCRHPVAPGAADDLRNRQLAALNQEMAILVQEAVRTALADRGAFDAEDGSGRSPPTTVA